ncbi:uncharacterized protein LOC113345027 [Papaver somniferum]|uniref:uncharacterized protein LOC113345027 n=1 Tax=Papaver somniferum TaxID=3469 RepID=UPI000E6F559D|nr:uncharacterized protein LOC113345027 [Papaver somniferum]
MDPNTSSSSFEISYLMNSCGLSEKEALTVCKTLKFESSTKPDAVLAVFKDYGFTKSDISRIICKHPHVILIDIDKNIKPKFDYLISKDISRPQVIKLFSYHPKLLNRSLENHVIPFYDFVKNIVGTDKDVLTVFERARNSAEAEKMMPNIQALRDEGVPQSNIVKFLIQQPRALLISNEKFKDAVQEIKSMGFDDPYQYAFLTGIQALTAMKKSVWETKVNAYKKWGLSEEQIQSAFKAHPICMTISVKKIMAAMDYFVNQAGYSPSAVVKTPATLFFSLEERIIPRVSVYRSLVSKGLIYKNKTSLFSILSMYEKPFLEKFVIKYQKDAPELMEIYNQALNGCVMEEAMEGSAMKKEDDKCIEEEEIDHVPGVDKVVEDSQKAASNKVEESKKANKPEKILKKSNKKLEQVQDTAAIKCLVEVPGLLQASNRPVTEDLQNKEVTFCPESATKSVAALSQEANVVDKSEVGEANKKASSSDLVEQEKKLEEAEDLKKAKTPKKIFIKSEKFFEEPQGSVAEKEAEEKSKEEEEIVAVPMVEKILEESDASTLKRKFVLGIAEEPKKAKMPKKFLRK